MWNFAEFHATAPQHSADSVTIRRRDALCVIESKQSEIPIIPSHRYRRSRMLRIVSQTRRMMHTKCRNALYPRSKVQRFPVTDEHVGWSKPFDNYQPVYHESPTLANKQWADPNIGAPGFQPAWNQLDQGNIDRRSHMGPYEIVDAKPQNPVGRTGIAGRGVLGRWGPNHAADPIVTRWKQQVHESSKRPILQFCAIQRHDNGEWAIPGGMVDPGELVSQTLMREFMEEAMNSLEKTSSQKEEIRAQLQAFFSTGVEVYRGYVDDPRNTDNAWMETVAYNFHDETGEHVGKFALTAGDDAQNVRWMDIDRNLRLYASHSEFIERVAHERDAHF